MFYSSDDLAVLALAVLLDLTLGEPPTRMHPTAVSYTHLRAHET